MHIPKYKISYLMAALKIINKVSSIFNYGVCAVLSCHSELVMSSPTEHAHCTLYNVIFSHC